MKRYDTRVRGTFSNTRTNKKLVEVHNQVKCYNFTDEEIAKMIDVPRSSYNKTKLGYFHADDSMIRKLEVVARKLKKQYDAVNVNVKSNDVKIKLPLSVINIEIGNIPKNTNSISINFEG